MDSYRTYRAGRPLGETITPDGKYLLAADGNGAVVISVARAESAAASAVLGTLSVPSGSGTRQDALSASAIEVATSTDGRYAFVTLEYDQQAAVFNLADAVSRRFGSAAYVGSIPLGQAAVGLAVSPTAAGYTRRARPQPGSASGGPQGVACPRRDNAQRAARHAVRAGTPMVVADSNRFSASGSHAELTVINVADALDGRPAIVGDIPAGLPTHASIRRPGCPRCG